MRKPAHLRSTVWTGYSEELYRNVMQAPCMARVRKTGAFDLADLLASSEWTGSEVVYTAPGIATVTHPSGAVARVKVEVGQ